MLTVSQRKEFDDRGLLHLPAAIAADDTQRMRHALWQHLARMLQQRCDLVAPTRV